MANPKTLTWTNPTQYTDGSAYPQSDNVGYTIKFDGVGAVAIPLAYGTTFDLSSLAAYQALKRGSHTVALAAVSKAGIESAFSTPATFQIEVAPVAPSNLSVS
jgi:hypothetical protein